MSPEIMELLMRNSSINIDELLANIDSLLKYKPKVEFTISEDEDETVSIKFPKVVYNI